MAVNFNFKTCIACMILIMLSVRLDVKIVDVLGFVLVKEMFKNIDDKSELKIWLFEIDQSLSQG